MFSNQLFKFIKFLAQYKFNFMLFKYKFSTFNESYERLKFNTAENITIRENNKDEIQM